MGLAQARPTYKSLLQFSHLFGCRLSEDQLSPGPAVHWTRYPSQTWIYGPRTRCAVATQEVYMTGYQCSIAHRLFLASRGEEYSLGIRSGRPLMTCFKVQSRDHYAGVSTRVYLRHHMQSTNADAAHTRRMHYIVSLTHASTRLDPHKVFGCWLSEDQLSPGPAVP